MALVHIGSACDSSWGRRPQPPCEASCEGRDVEGVATPDGGGGVRRTRGGGRHSIHTPPFTASSLHTPPFIHRSGRRLQSQRGRKG